MGTSLDLILCKLLLSVIIHMADGRVHTPAAGPAFYHQHYTTKLRTVSYTITTLFYIYAALLMHNRRHVFGGCTFTKEIYPR